MANIVKVLASVLKRVSALIQRSDTLCPVCGYNLELSNVAQIVERCPSCGFDFQELGNSKAPFNHFDVENFFVRHRRSVWIEARMRWNAKDVLPPKDWDAVKQLYRLGIQLGASYEEWDRNNPAITPENSPKFLQIALLKINQLAWKPKVIEALWDGDTQGWCLDLSVSTNEFISSVPEREQKEFNLFIWRGSGGDMRLFNGQVPPWPEAQLATLVGEELSKRLGIPFYFPSPDQPNDDYARWWARDEQKRCMACRRYMHDDRELCFLCEQQQRKSL